MGALAILCILPWSEAARAERAPLSLTWEAPPECPGRSDVLHRVEQILRDVQASTTVEVTARAARTADGRFEVALTVRTDGLAETKTMVASTCGALAEASAVVIALAVHPSDATPPETPTEAPPSPQPSPDSPAPSPRTAETSAPHETSTPWAVAFGLGPSFSVAALPEASAGFVVSAGVRIERFRFGVLGTLSARQHPRFDGSAGASIDMAEAGVFGAYLAPLGPIAIGPAANVEATYVRVEGFNIQSPESASSVWPTFVLGARLEAPLGRKFALFARGDALFAPTAHPITLQTVSGPMTLHDPSLVAPRLSFGAEIVLP